MNETASKFREHKNKTISFHVGRKLVNVSYEVIDSNDNNELTSLRNKNGRAAFTASRPLHIFIYRLFNTSFIFLTASPLLLNAAFSSSFSSNSTIFSQPFFPITTGTPIEISFCPYSPSK